MKGSNEAFLINALQKDKFVDIMREFNIYIKKDNRIKNVILPLGDGLTVCLKR